MKEIRLSKKRLKTKKLDFDQIELIHQRRKMWFTD